MRFTKWRWGVLAVGVLVGVAAPAGAKPGDPGEPAHGEGKGEHERRDRDRDDRGRDEKGKGEHGRPDDAGKDKDKDKDKDDEKSASERREFRRGLFERREKAIVEQLNRDRREMTEDMREAIRMHWRHLSRLVRIRELAVMAKEEAFVKRVESDIDREEKAFAARLEKLRSKASAEGGAR